MGLCKISVISCKNIFFKFRYQWTCLGTKELWCINQCPLIIWICIKKNKKIYIRNVLVAFWFWHVIYVTNVSSSQFKLLGIMRNWEVSWSMHHNTKLHHHLGYACATAHTHGINCNHYKNWCTFSQTLFVVSWVSVIRTVSVICAWSHSFNEK